MIWIMAIAGPSRWAYIKPEAPCWKGEVRASFRAFHLTIGWQAMTQRRHDG